MGGGVETLKSAFCRLKLAEIFSVHHEEKFLQPLLGGARVELLLKLKNLGKFGIFDPQRVLLRPDRQ